MEITYRLIILENSAYFKCLLSLVLISWRHRPRPFLVNHCRNAIILEREKESLLSDNLATNIECSAPFPALLTSCKIHHEYRLSSRCRFQSSFMHIDTFTNLVTWWLELPFPWQPWSEKLSYKCVTFISLKSHNI